MSTLELQPMALPARGRPSAPALLVAAAVHLVLLWALLQSPPVERASAAGDLPDPAARHAPGHPATTA
jgi:hypothetical protein